MFKNKNKNKKKQRITKAGEQKTSSWLISWFNQQLLLAPKCQLDLKKKKSQGAGNSVLCGGKDLTCIPGYTFWYTDFPYEFLIGRKIWGYGIARKARSGAHSNKMQDSAAREFYPLQFGKQSEYQVLCYQDVSSCLLRSSCGLHIDVQREKTPGKMDRKYTHIYYAEPLQWSGTYKIFSQTLSSVCLFLASHYK